MLPSPTAEPMAARMKTLRELNAPRCSSECSRVWLTKVLLPVDDEGPACQKRGSVHRLARADACAHARGAELTLVRTCRACTSVSSTGGSCAQPSARLFSVEALAGRLLRDPGDVEEEGQSAVPEREARAGDHG